MKALICALAVLAALALPARARADQSGFLYAYALQDARFNDTIFSVDATKPVGSPQATIRPYFEAFYTRDTRTTGGRLPQTFADNYLLGAAGLQAQFADGLRLFAQVGAAQQIGEPSPDVTQQSGGDFRGGAQLYREWSVPLGDPGPIGSFYGSAAYYSRYRDGIVYLQAERGRAFGHGRTTDVYARVTVTADTQGYYYDNVAELGVGVRIHPFGAQGPSLALEGFGGVYLRAGSPTGSTYVDLRPTLTLGVAF
ncbi:MAG TPA: hypothetical protein VNJ51_03615 [Candidatus Dormibacteraeota bacterium]|nr:hypothetical protein [Candidatus Dormibacteraeota bacterium]